MILSACMMLDHLNETEKADRIRTAVAKVIEEGKVRTYDMMKLRGGPKAIENGSCTTQEMTDTIIAKI
jgi:3-isopropylmalate dehydrogenase